MLRRALLDQAHALDAALVAGEAAPHVVEQSTVDLEDDLQMARQEQLERRDGPLFESLGQQRVVGVCQCSLSEVPSLIPSEMRLVEQDSHQLGDGNGRMGIVELNGYLFGKLVPAGIRASISPDQIGQRARDEKVLLQESQPLSAGCRVVRIEHPSERLGGERSGQRADELTVTERLEIEVVRRRCRPEPKRV